MRVTPECDSIESLWISGAEGSQSTPDVAFGADNYLVVWMGPWSESPWGIWAARVSPEGAVLDTGIFIGSTSFLQWKPEVAFDGTRFLVVWSEYDYPSEGIYGRFVGVDGQPQDSLVPITATSGMRDHELAFDGINYLVVWQRYSTSNDIFAQRVSPSGSLVGSEIEIATGPGDYTSPSVCYDGTNYLVVWVEEQVWGQFVSGSGSLVGPRFRVSDSPGIQADPGVGYGQGKFLVAWSESLSADGYDIYGNMDTRVGAEEFGVSPSGAKVRPGTIFVSDFFELIGAEGREMLVFDTSGRQVAKTWHGRWYTGSVAPGIYFIKVNPQGTHKIVKLR